jgi:hypothetical protein
MRAQHAELTDLGSKAIFQEHHGKEEFFNVHPD